MLSEALVRGTRARGLATIALAAVLWGTVGVTTQAVYYLADTSSLAVAFLRLALAAPALALASAVGPGRRGMRVARPHLALMGLTGAMLALYQLCYFAAIARVGVSVATLVTLCTAPVLVAVLSAVVLRERPTGRSAVALGGALVGTALLVDRSADGEAGSSALIGVLLATGSSLGYAVVALCSRFLARRYGPLESMAVSFGTGALLLLPVAGAAGLGDRKSTRLNSSH